jgi:hypothetical protein
MEALDSAASRLAELVDERHRLERAGFTPSVILADAIADAVCAMLEAGSAPPTEMPIADPLEVEARRKAFYVVTEPA